MADDALSLAPTTCTACGTHLAPALLACPSCRRLLHAEELARLAAAAEASERTGDAAAALASWRRTLDLLPPDAAQATKVRDRVAKLSAKLEAQPAKPHGPMPAWLSSLGVVGVLLWKFKFALVFLLTKGKLLLLGLTKSSTLFSMLLSLGVYWTIWGWPFALGFVLSIYVHEMGHVAALTRLGIPASAPMFIPGFGALVRLHQYPASPAEDARVGLAGPIWGVAAAFACWALFAVTDNALFAALAHAGAIINLFNLIPVWQLDGSRGFHAIARRDRGILAALFGCAALAAHQPMFLLVALAAGWRAFQKDAPAASDRRAFVEFVVLVLAIAVLAMVKVPGLPAA